MPQDANGDCSKPAYMSVYMFKATSTEVANM